MTSRERFIRYVVNGRREPFVSLQIGAGAGFDAKLAGKEWIGDSTIDDTIRAYELVGGEPLFNIGLPDLGSVVPELSWHSEVSVKNNVRTTTRHLDTPYGQLIFEYHEQKKLGCTPVKFPLAFGDSLDPVMWIADQYAKAVPFVAELLGPSLDKLRPHGAVSVQWNLQPFEIFGLANAVEQVVMLHSDTEAYRAVCDHVREVNLALAREVIGAGADFVFLGGPGREIASPLVYEEFLIPDSQIISNAVHDAGGLIYCHICSPVEPFLSKGYYNQMGLDLFETLSPPPVGNVEDLAQARRTLPPEMCTRGNIGLDVLLNGTIDDIQRETLRILDATKDYKHMVAASDYLFYDIPLESARALVETVRQYNADTAVDADAADS